MLMVRSSFLKNSEVLEISPKNKEVKLANGNSIKFDKLLISAGAKPITPKGIMGLDLDGVHVMGTLDSVLGILDHIQKGVKHALVVGGGFMGIETATMLKKRGIDVTIIEMLPDILSRMLDADMSEKVVEILKKHGIKLVLNDSIKSINGKKCVESVTLGKKMMSCDMVILSIGVIPNIDITHKYS